MARLKPSENSQIFKRLYTEKSKIFDKLKKKNELCEDYCEILGVPVEKSKPGQNEYKQLSFDKHSSIPKDRAEKVIDLYTAHINAIEAAIRKPVFSEEDIQNTPGLVRCKAQKRDALYDRKLGRIILQLDQFYQLNSEQSFSVNLRHYLNKPRILHIAGLILLLGIGIIYATIKWLESVHTDAFAFEELYTQEKHDEILNQRVNRIEEELTVLYENIKTSNQQNDKLIKLLEKELYETRWDLSSAENNVDSYAEQLAFLQERNNYLNSIKDQLAPELYIEAQEALTQGNKLKAYELYEDFKQKGEYTIQQIAQANYEQGLIDEDRIKYHDAFARYKRAAYLQADNAEYNNKAGVLADILGDYHGAITYFEKALASDLEAFGEAHPTVARDWSNLGKTWQTLAKYDKAIAYSERALDSNLNNYGVDHPSVADNWKILGESRFILGQNDEAIEYYEKALASDLKRYGDNHPIVAKDINMLGEISLALGQLDKAIEYHEKALRTDLEAFGESHPTVARDWLLLGYAWMTLAKYDKSMEYFEKALASDLKTYGDDHPSVALDRCTISYLWIIKGQYDKGIEYAEKALASDLKTYGEDHPYIARDRSSLGWAWFSKGQYDKAIEHYKVALKIDSSTYGDDHPNITRHLSDLAMSWNTKGQRDKAIGYYEKALEIIFKNYDEDHPSVAVLRNNLAMTWKGKGQYSKAIKYIEKALASDLKIYGENHPGIAIYWNNLGEIYYSKGQYDKAIVYYNKALPILQASLGNEHQRTKKCLKKLQFAKNAIENGVEQLVNSVQ